MTSREDMDLSTHVLQFCKLNPKACRLALTDLLMQTVNEAGDISDEQIWKLMQSHLKCIPRAKVHEVYLRCVATMAKPPGLSPILPYALTPGGWQVPSAFANIAPESLTDDEDTDPEPLTEPPANCAPKDEEAFWNPEQNSKYWEPKWIIGIEIIP